MAALELSDGLLFSIPLLLSASTLSWMHWLPWHRGTRQLDRVTAYTLGTSVVVGFPIAAMLVADAMNMHHGERWWALHLLANTIISGATVSIAYYIDGNRAVSSNEVQRDRGL